ncbi:MAG: hypothetical protein M3P06_02120 [Acidobacteriota bacterium]|nr:hypothetical protein [Acidobacteriota bacterium]
MSRLRDAVERARLLLKAHHQVEQVSDARQTPDGLAVDIRLRVNLPFAWSAVGKSPTGVGSIEPVTIHFPTTYPRRAPDFHARQDFDRRLAHTNPGSKDGPVRPCIFEGDTTELLHHAGLLVLVDHLVAWFEKAARGTLIDAAQGWEPVRRDSINHVLVIDADHLRAQATPEGGYSVRFFTYQRISVGKDSRIYGEIRNDRSKLSLIGKNSGLFGESAPDSPIVLGRSVALIAWPGTDANGNLIIDADYEPETVTELATLVSRATKYGCETQLREGFSFLQRSLKDHSGGPMPIAVVLCVRRPHPLINSDSELELCPYLVQIQAPQLFPSGDATPVEPTGHHDAIGPRLLRRMAGDDPERNPRALTLLGCGSLGSKIGIHLTRRGMAPTDLIDKGLLSPHNAARHALLPPQGTQLPWLISKALALRIAIEGFGQRASAHTNDLIGINGKDFRRLIPTSTAAIINTTASIAVAETLAILTAEPPLPRVIDASLISGKIGILSLEGDSRNPNIGDLYAETYTRLTTADLETGDLKPAPIGQGCSSLTMTMSDARISMFAAPMSEQIARWANDAFPNDGNLLIGRVAPDGMSLTWEHTSVPPVRVARIDDTSMRIRISARANAQIEADLARWPGVETGGVLLGRQSEAANAFYVTDVLDAPDDSTRAAGLFELGTTGLRARIKEYIDAHHGLLFCLGTWHSHLTAQGASATDRGTARVLGISRAIPSVMLIHTPTGYRAILAS